MRVCVREFGLHVMHAWGTRLSMDSIKIELEHQKELLVRCHVNRYECDA